MKLNTIFTTENNIQLVTEQVKGKLVAIKNDNKDFGAIIEKGVHNGRTLYYSEQPQRLKSDDSQVRRKAYNDLIKIELVKSDVDTMNDLFLNLNDKNDIIYTPNFYNYINKVIYSANNKMLRYRSEKLSLTELQDIRQFFLTDILEQVIKVDTIDKGEIVGTEQLQLDFNRYNDMNELNYILHKIATSEINSRMYKMYRDISLDNEIDRIQQNDRASKIIQEINLTAHNDELEFTENSHRIDNLRARLKEVATDKQWANFKIVQAKQEYEQATTYEERQAMTEQQKLKTYKLTNNERYLYHALVKKALAD